eukprot:4839936-Prymnesium_polylepis.1
MGTTNESRQSSLSCIHGDLAVCVLSTAVACGQRASPGAIQERSGIINVRHRPGNTGASRDCGASHLRSRSGLPM